MNYTDFINFVRDVFHDKEGFIILHDPRFIGNERKYLMDAMDSNFVSSVGEYVGKFEKAIAEGASEIARIADKISRISLLIGCFI